MSIVFNKRKVQQKCQEYIDEEKRSNPSFKFNTFVLTSANESVLRILVIEDAVDFYYNALVSFLNALESFSKGNYSWPCVQLYYSLYYSLRSYLGFDNKALVRDGGGLFLLDIQEGLTPIRNSSMKSANTDHKGTIFYYKNCYGSVDRVSNLVIGESSLLDWMLDLREVTNYREHRFLEPNPRSFMRSYATDVVVNPDFFIQRFVSFDDPNNSDTYLVTEASAWLSIPYHYLNKVATEYQKSSVSLDQPQIDYVSQKLSILNLSSFQARWL